MISYHGTCAENVQAILDNGFQPESWFAKEKDSARIYGGPFVFSVWFSDDPDMWYGEPWEDDWQFHISDWHEPKNINGISCELLLS